MKWEDQVRIERKEEPKEGMWRATDKIKFHLRDCMEIYYNRRFLDIYYSYLSISIYIYIYKGSE